MRQGAASEDMVVFCDLDGTAVLDNSFHIFLAAAWSKGSAQQRLALGVILLKRALGRVYGGHSGLKRRALTWFSRQPRDWQDTTVQTTLQRLDATRSHSIFAELRHYTTSGAEIVLATAAPDIYARPFANRIGASDCLATHSSPGTGWHELLGQHKASACAAWLAKRGGSPKVVVLTDHADDLPLLRLADEAVIQASAARFDEIRAQLSPYRPTLRHIDTDKDEENGGYWLWFDDRPSGPHDGWEIRTILSKHRYAQIYAGGGVWRKIGPGKTLLPAGLRRDCPRPPSSRKRLAVHINRRIQRDWLGIFH